MWFKETNVVFWEELFHFVAVIAIELNNLPTSISFFLPLPCFKPPPMSLPTVPMQLVIVSADDDPLSCARTQSWQSAGRKFLAPQHVITSMRRESWLAGDEKWPARRQLEIGDSSSFPRGSFPLQNLFQSSSLGCTVKEGFRFYRSVNMFGGKELSGGQLPVKTDGWQPAMRNSSPGCWEREMPLH